MSKGVIQRDDLFAKEQAYLNVIGGLVPERRFPKMVFLGVWRSFLFFESDRIFASGFVEVIADLLRADNSSVCCLLNITEAGSSELYGESAIYVDSLFTESEYRARLRGDGPATGWLYSMDRYGCASNKGEWEIYCEKDSDIAVIGFRNENGVRKFREAIRKLRAASIESLKDGELANLFPFSHLSLEWKRDLSNNYHSENMR